MKQNFLYTQTVQKQAKKKASKIGTKAKTKGKSARPSRINK